MWCHREDLIERLDHVLGQLDRGLEYFKQHKPRFDDDGGTIEHRKELYGRLREELLEMDKKATRTLSCRPLMILFDQYADFTNMFRNTLDRRLCPPSTLSVILFYGSVRDQELCGGSTSFLIKNMVGR